MLVHERRTLDYFFEDKNGKNKASDLFINEVLTQLDSRLYEPGEIIMERNSRVRDLIFIAQGTCKLFGFYEQKDGDLIRMVIVRLREGSWYGDFQVLMDCESSFELEAHKPFDLHSKLTKQEDAHSFI